MYECEVICDSYGPNGKRLTTLAVTTWKSVVAEFNTHCILSRNSASSRAIPAARLRKQLEEKPHIPQFRINAKGMTAGRYCDEWEQEEHTIVWLAARNSMFDAVDRLTATDHPHLPPIHKQWANRLTEPWMETTIVVTATEWQNFLNLRLEQTEEGLPAPQPEMYYTAEAMEKALMLSTPEFLPQFCWHAPYAMPNDISAEELAEAVVGRHYGSDAAMLTGDGRAEMNQGWFYRCMISAGRCATVSYDNLGEGVDVAKDLDRGFRLLKAGHMSVFQHQGMSLPPQMFIDSTVEPRNSKDRWSGNFKGWEQFRKIMNSEGLYKPSRKGGYAEPVKVEGWY